MTDEQLAALLARLTWLEECRPDQLAPDEQVTWNIWLFLAGRGAGKTRAAAEDMGWYAWTNPGIIGHVVAPTHNDLRTVCFEGNSGLMSVIPREIVRDYNRSLQELFLVNGSIIRGYSAQDPNRLRGPQCHRLWGDEFAAWDQPVGNAQAVLDMALMGLRLGQAAKAILTTTPRPIPILRKLLKRKDIVVSRATTYANLQNLADNFKQTVLQYEGTQLGRQEIYAELLDPEEQGIVKRSWFKLWPHDKLLPRFEFIVMSLDTAFSEENYDTKTGNTDPTACSVWGIFKLPNNIESGYRCMLLDCWEARLGFDELVERTKKEAAFKYGPTEKAVGLIVIEDKGSGISLRQVMSKRDARTYAYNPGRADKLQRLHMVSHLPKHGLIYLPESEHQPGEPKTWVSPLLDQVCSFHGEGTTEHDDYLDTFTQAMRVMQDKELLRVTPVPIVLPKHPPGWKPENPYAA